MKQLYSLVYLCCIFAAAQPPNDGFYVNSVEKDVFKIPDSDVINHTKINNRTYETYFYANTTATRQFIFMEGNDDRGVLAYIENGYLVVGAYNIDNDYTNIWGGTYFRKLVSANAWYHVALVFDNALVPAAAPAVTALDNTALKWYLNGVLQDEKAGFQIGGSGNHNKLNVGFEDDKLYFPTVSAIWTASNQSHYSFAETIEEGGAGINYFDGYLWGFRVWNTARTATEINNNKSDLILPADDANILAALDGDTVTYLDNSSLPQERDSESPPTTKEWEGNQSVVWSDPLNWRNSLVPDNAKQEPVQIKTGTFYPEVTTSVVIGDLDIDPSALLTIKDGGAMDVAYDLNNDGALTVEDNGTLVIRESKPITGIGSYAINRASPTYPEALFFSIWSSPVTEADSNIGTIFGNEIDAFKYDASQDPGAYVQIYGTDNMAEGHGYFIRPTDTGGAATRIFTGTLNNGNINVPIYYNSPTDNYNLIGNPFLSAINWLEFRDDNDTVLDGTMYYWNQTVTGPNNSASDYISFNSTGSNPPGASEFIGSGQGFFVKSLQAGTVTFKNDHKESGNNGQFYSTEDEEDPLLGRSWFRISGTNGFSSMLIGFIDGATTNVDQAYDGEFINDGADLELYSFINGEKYAIQGQEELVENDNKTIDLGYEVLTAGDFTISIDLEYINPDFDILLEDTQENIVTDLRISDYTFNLSAPVEDNARFKLHYNYRTVLGVPDLNSENTDIKSYFSGNTLVSVVNSQSVPTQLEIYNITGKKILSGSFNERTMTNNISSGIYMVRYLFDGRPSLTKKVLKN